MKRIYLLIVAISTVISISSFAQEEYPEEKYSLHELKPLRSIDQQKLRALPELQLPVEFKNTTLPYAVDNSTQPYMRDMFCQSGLDCGQAASVAIGFTYEINRLRNLASDQLSTTYPSYFTWNWENGGNGWYGVSYYHSMEVLRMVGCPNLEIYGEEVNGGDNIRFMDGYDNYLHAMANRIQAAYCIDVSDEEGLTNLKHWLDHHHEGSDVGGLAFFYSQYQSPGNTLPEESEHTGEHVIISWGSSPNHGMAIVGYNDSIKWDFNGDGQYTNDIDITGDGIVDLRDREIGALKMCNTYHSYPTYSWGDNGYSWMMYRTLALGQYNGGIWNQTVNVLVAKENYDPQLTMKINMSHNKRGRVKMNVGMTTDLTSDEPMYILDFPIFDYQGADKNMQGGTEAGDETIEFGFDLTPFLNYLSPGQTARYIFQLEESDDDNTGTGQLNSMSIIDYTGDNPVETDCGQSDIDIINNGLLRVPVNLAVNFDPPQITTDDLPLATVYEPYSYTLNANNGTPPYRWSWDMDFEIESTDGSYPSLTGNSLPTGGSTWTAYNLPFEFPFYDSVYSTVYVYKTGAVMMEQLPTDLPYNSDDDIVFFNRKIIAAMYAEENGSLGSPNLEVVENSDNVHFTWTSTSYNFSIRLYETGQIKIYYGNNDLGNLPIWVAGVSSGDKENQQMLGISNAGVIDNGLTYTLTPHPAPEEFDISEEGEITGTPTQQYLAENFYIKVTDNNNLVDHKTIPISTDGFIINYAFHTTDNDILENGESATMDITLINETGQNVTGITCYLSSVSDGVTLTDTEEVFGDIDAEGNVTITDAFAFDLDFSFENGEPVEFLIEVNADQEDWQRPIEEPVYAPDIIVYGAQIDDGDNGRLDEGENTDYLLTVQNNGGAEISNISFTLSTSDPYLTINDPSDFTALLDPETQDQLSFNLTADASTPQGHVAPMMLHWSNSNYEDSIQLFVSIGLIVEDWETEDMQHFSWVTEGNTDWFISNDTSYNGSFCLESGDINDSEVSELKIGVQVLTTDTIRFYRKVSCELDANNTNWDYLAFFIDGVEQARWDGEQDWQQFSYPVSAGFRIFEWKYIKDGSVSSFEDCAWIDDIIFPSIYDAPPLFSVSVDSIWKQLPADTTDTDTIVVSNLGGGIISYSLELRNVPSSIPSTKSIAGSTVSCSSDYFTMGESVSWDISVTNGSEDSEWIKQIVLDFPTGMDVTSATDFYDSNDTLFSNGLLGDGIIITWFNETDAGWGIITAGETGTAHITADIAEDFAGDMEIEYQLVGDIYGSEPHYINDILTIENLGPPIDWLSVSPENGQTYQPNSDSITLNWNTAGMAPGLYEASLNIYMENDTVEIPVTLEVTWPVNIEENNTDFLSIFPNPARDIVNISLNTQMEEKTIVSVKDINGKCIDQVEFEATDDRYSTQQLHIENLKTGIYIISIRSGNQSYNKKLIVL